MLILSRRVSEEIVIGDEVFVIRVIGIRQGQVQLGITAPSGSPVFRREIFEKIKRNGETLATPEAHRAKHYGPLP